MKTKKPRGIDRYEPMECKATRSMQYDSIPASVPTNRVWSIIEGDSGDTLYAAAGYHVVNHLYYIVTKKPWKKGTECYRWF